MSSVYNAIMALDKDYPNAIPVFGGALEASKYITAEHVDFEAFLVGLQSVIHNAKFYHWHEGALGAACRFCHLCSVDPALIECYLMIPFETLCQIG